MASDNESDDTSGGGSSDDNDTPAVSAFAKRPGLEKLVAEALASPAKSITRRSTLDFGDSDSDDGVDIYGPPPAGGMPAAASVRRNLSSVEEEKVSEPRKRQGRSRRGAIASPSPSPPLPLQSVTPGREPPTNAEVAAAAAAAAAQLQSPATATHGRSTRKSPQGTTTARKPKITKASTAIRVGGRVYTTRKKVFLTVLSEAQRASVRDFADHYRLFGTVISGRGQAGYNVEFDVFPANEKIVKGLVRKRLTTLPKGAEEQQRPASEWERFSNLEESGEEDNNQNNTQSNKRKTKSKKVDPYKKSTTDFMELDDDILRDVNRFELFYGDAPEELITWDIHGDQQYLPEENNNMTIPSTLEMKKEIDFKNVTFDDIFFEHFFPSIKGHAKLMDEYLADPRSPYYATAKQEKIKFHQEGDDDPDWVVRQCYLLMIAAVTEADIGVDNLWKRGDSGGRRPHADFGQYMPKNYYKAFQSAAALMWCDRKWWYVDKRDRNWAIFEPCLASFNEKRRDLFYVTLLMLDESMSGWRPKTSVTGGLPNLTHEPRKPVDLGTQLRNGVECLSGVMVFQDVVATSEVHRLKDYYYSDKDNLQRAVSSLPGKPEIHAHVAEVLRQVDGAGVRKDGWVGGDAWFGSIMAAVELKLQLGVNSTFVMKSHTRFFPMGPLYAVLKARHGARPAGHWVTMQTVISGVKMCAIAYAWSQKGVNYFITTCGSTEPSPILYETKFEDEWGRTGFKEIQRPKILHFLYEYLPLIDEHNKQRQGLLALEKRWLTKNAWFRLTTSLLGMSIVDMHRYYRYHEIKMKEEKSEEADILKILKFTDRICGNLRQWEYKNRRTQQTDIDLFRIQCKDKSGRVNRPPSASQLRAGKCVGNAYTLTCFICRRYQNEQGDQRQQTTQWWCKECRMPLCNEDRIGDDGGRLLSCKEEHLQSEHPALACNSVMHRGACVPADCVISLHPRRNTKRRKAPI